MAKSIEQYKREAELAHEMWNNESHFYSVGDIAKAYNKKSNSMHHFLAIWKEKLPGWFESRELRELELYKEEASLAHEMWMSEDPYYIAKDIAKAYGMPVSKMQNQISRWRGRLGWFKNREPRNPKTKFKFKPKPKQEKKQFDHEIVGAFRDVEYDEIYIALPNRIFLYIDGEGGISVRLFRSKKTYFSFIEGLVKESVSLYGLCKIWGYSKVELEDIIRDYFDGDIEDLFVDAEEENKKWIIDILQRYRENTDSDYVINLIDDAIEKVINNSGNDDILVPFTL